MRGSTRASIERRVFELMDRRVIASEATPFF
jgi:hypothetical protein